MFTILLFKRPSILVIVSCIPIKKYDHASLSCIFVSITWLLGPNMNPVIWLGWQMEKRNKSIEENWFLLMKAFGVSFSLTFFFARVSLWLLIWFGVAELMNKFKQRLSIYIIFQVSKTYLILFQIRKSIFQSKISITIHTRETLITYILVQDVMI